MTNLELRKKLTMFIDKNRPLCCLRKTYFVILRTTKLQIVAGDHLRLGDIRILTFEAKDFVTGLSPDQWTTLLSKCVVLQAISKTDIV